MSRTIVAIATLLASAICSFGIFLPVPQGTWTNGVTSYVTTTGNDGTFVRGNPAFPALTINFAVSNMLVGDTLSIGSGNFNVSNAIAQPRNSVIWGAGRSSTIISNWFISSPLMIPSDNSAIRNLTVWGRTGPFAPAWGGQFMTAFTNALLSGVGISNQIDCLFLETSNACSAQIDGCVFESTWDIIVSRMLPLGYTGNQSQIRVYNTPILVRDGDIDFGGLDVQGNGNLIALFGCGITTQYPGRFVVLSDGGRVTFEECTFSYPTIVPGSSVFVHELNNGPFSTNNVVEVYKCDIPDVLVKVDAGQGILRFNAPSRISVISGSVINKGGIVIR